MFPIDFLRMSASSEVTIYMKNGEMLKGILMSIDNYMNLRLKKACLTSKDGKGRSMEEVYIRGIEIKNIQLPDSVMDAAAAIEKDRQYVRIVQPRVVTQPRKESFRRSSDHNRQFQPRNSKSTQLVVKDAGEDWLC